MVIIIYLFIIISMSNSTGNMIEIAWGEAECYFNSFTSAIDS